MKVNRFGKKIYELGYKSIREFVEANDIKASTDLINRWSTQGCTPYEVHAETLNKLTGIFDCSRTELLNMIASKPTFDIKSGRELPKADADNILKRKRYDLGFSAAEMAEYIGLNDRQIIIDIENGKRAKFPVGNDEAFEKYLDALDISFGQFAKALTDIREKHLKNTKVVTIKPDIAESDHHFAEKLYQNMNGEIVSDEEVNPWVDIFKKTGESQKDIVNVNATDEEVEAFKEAMNNVKLEVMAVEPTPKCKLPAEDMQTVMSLLYGKLDFATFKKVENILMGVI